jgi:hypothetical protein
MTRPLPLRQRARSSTATSTRGGAKRRRRLIRNGDTALASRGLNIKEGASKRATETYKPFACNGTYGAGRAPADVAR